jgi:hypothetical protein
MSFNFLEQWSLISDMPFSTLSNHEENIPNPSSGFLHPSAFHGYPLKAHVLL